MPPAVAEDLELSSATPPSKTAYIRDGELTTEMIKVLVHANFATMDRYFPGTMAVLSGGASPEAAVVRIETAHVGDGVLRESTSTHEQRDERPGRPRSRFPWMAN